ncbi:MAG TPA: hypothetical protein VLZ78_04375, partial [Terrimesophilobacter sp.]|nr:hypothetical protein [Terrimesophilobacter sp.]
RPGHPLVAAMIEHGVTLVEVAKKVKRSRSTVQAWMLPKDDDNHRPIPEDAKKILLDEYGVPISTWK